MTLAQKLSKEPDSVLLPIWNEIASGYIPATGAANAYRRQINKMIDAGDMQINKTNYRKIYMPSLAKAVQYELASRYVAYSYNRKG